MNRWKRGFTVLTAAMSCLVGVPAVLPADAVMLTVRAADDGYYNNLEYWASDADNITITGCDRYAVDVTIPSEIKAWSAARSKLIDMPVTEIQNSAFQDCANLIRVTIPDSVTNIGDFAFDGCTSLIEITIPDSVTSIGAFAFYDCTNLNKITISDSMTSISDHMFCFCTNLTTITIPEGVTEIGDAAFSVTGLASITIPESVTRIGDGVFEDSNLKDVYYTGTEEQWNAIGIGSDNAMLTNATIHFNALSFTKPGTLTFELNDYGTITITDCDESVVEMDIPAEIEGIAVTEIGDYAFENCTSLKRITIPESVTEIGGYAFSGCSGLTDIVVPGSVTKIDTCAFSDCSGLKHITISEGVMEISHNAFSECASLEDITIPESVKSIEKPVFNGCHNLTDIYYAGTVKRWQTVGLFYSDELDDVTIHFNATASNPADPIYGDTDENGEVDIMDVILLNRNLMIGAEISAQGMRNADVDEDGSADAVDSLNILKAIVKLITLPVA